MSKCLCLTVIHLATVCITPNYSLRAQMSPFCTEKVQTCTHFGVLSFVPQCKILTHSVDGYLHFLPYSTGFLMPTASLLKKSKYPSCIESRQSCEYSGLEQYFCLPLVQKCQCLAANYVYRVSRGFNYLSHKQLPMA